VANGFDWKQPKTQFDLRALLPPSQSTLEKVFEFLMRKLLGEYKMEPGMKLETEVPHLANLLGYPYASSLKTNVLRAPNIASAVPVICGLLDWLREEVQVWLAMASNSDNGEDCGMATLFFRPDDGTEWNIDSVFHNVRDLLEIQKWEFFQKKFFCLRLEWNL
jgi:HEC/Ndc80p family